MGGEIVVEVRDRSREDMIMYDERPDLGHAAGVLARGVLWLGAAEGEAVQDRTDANLYADSVSSTALLGDAHGPRLLELLNAACG